MKVTNLNSRQIGAFAEKCAKDPIYFIKNMLNLNLTNAQKKIIESIEVYPTTVGLFSRQSGKSTAVAAYIVWRLMFGKGVIINKARTPEDILVAAPSLPQAKIIYDKVKSHMMRNDLLYSYILGDMTLEKIMVKNGNVCRVVSASANAQIRGLSPTVLILDESQDVADDVLNSVLLPMTTTTQAHRVYIGTPKNKNWFYKVINEDKDANVIKQIYKDCPFIDAAMIEKKRSDRGGTMPIPLWEQEYKCIFVESSSTAFPSDLVRPCLADYEISTKEFYKEDAVKPVSRERGDYVMGIDLGRERDATVITVVDRGVLPYKLAHTESHLGKTYTHIMGRVKVLSDHYNVAIINVDQTGEKGWGDLATEVGVVINPINFTLQNKDEMLNNLRVLFEKKLIQIPSRHELLYSQIVSQQYDQTIYGKKRYFHPADEHDDCFPGDTLVKTKNGWKQIRDIIEGEMVFTHRGRFRKVLRNSSRPMRVDEKIYEIKATGRPVLTATENHPIWLLDKNHDTKSRKNTIYFSGGTWVACKDILPGNCGTFMPIDRRSEQYTIDLLEFCPVSYTDQNGELVSFSYSPATKYKRIHNPKQNKIKRFIDVDNDTATVLGYYGAEGSYGKHNVSFASHEKETGVRTFVNNWFIHRGMNICERRHNIRGCIVSVGSMPFNGFFRIFKTGTQKQYPTWVETLDPSLQLSVLHGHFIGDGCFVDGGVRLKCVSKVMSYQIYEMLLRCGFSPVIRRTNVKGTKGYWDIGLSTQQTNAFVATIPEYLKTGKNIREVKEVNTADQINVKKTNDGIVSSVRKINRSLYCGEVWCLQVEEDESFVAELTAVHNCLWSLALASMALQIDVSGWDPKHGSVINEAMGAVLPDPGGNRINDGKSLKERDATILKAFREQHEQRKDADTGTDVLTVRSEKWSVGRRHD
jgi:intein/homing endonuclease